MAAYLHSIETIVPSFAHQQEGIAEAFLNHIEDRRTRLLLSKSMKGAGINTRYSVCSDFFGGDWFDLSASTGERNQQFAKHAGSLACDLGRNILEQSSTFDAEDITHVIFATCTGFSNPGPDYQLVKELGLNPQCQRLILGFMGCYSAVPALRTAAQICEADTNANVLVVTLELCSLHLKIDDRYDSILANSLFGDGAGAALISSQPPADSETRAASMGAFFSDIIPEGEPDMAWEIGDFGFDLVLSKQVPKVLEQGVRRIFNQDTLPFALSDIDHWAIHPGGKGILEKFATALDLTEQDLDCSYQTLRDYGNMAGATLFFVLKEVLEQAQEGDQILASAFGPGLSVEAGIFQAL